MILYRGSRGYLDMLLSTGKLRSSDEFWALDQFLSRSLSAKKVRKKAVIQESKEQDRGWYGPGRKELLLPLQHQVNSPLYTYICGCIVEYPQVVLPCALRG